MTVSGHTVFIRRGEPFVITGSFCLWLVCEDGWYITHLALGRT